MVITNKQLFIVLGLIFLAFTPLLKADFINFDDGVHVYDNPLVTTFSLHNVKEIFTQTINDTYVPLTTLSFSIENTIFGLNPLALHVDNIFLHLVVCFLLYRLGLAIKLGHGVSLLAVLLFGLHPMHVESVAWITERKDVLYSSLYLAALLSYIKYAQGLVLGSKRGYYLLSLGLCGLAILAKPMALSFPLILFVVDWYLAGLEGSERRIHVLDKIPFFAVVVPIALITFTLNQRPVPVDSHAALTWFSSFGFYLTKFFFPVNLSPIYQAPSLYIGLTVIPLGLTLWFLRHNRLFIFAIAYYFFSIFFLLRMDTTDIHVVADRFMYLPSVGLCFLIGYFINKLFALPRGRTPATAFVWVVVGVLFIQTFSMARIWQNYDKFWNYTIAHNPKCNELPFTVQGDKAYEQKEYAKAVDLYTIAITIRPTEELFTLRGKAEYGAGKVKEALDDFMHIKKNDETTLAWRGFLMMKLGRYEEAAIVLTQSIDQWPVAENYLNRGIAYKSLGQVELARADLARACELTDDVRVYKQCEGK